MSKTAQELMTLPASVAGRLAIAASEVATFGHFKQHHTFYRVQDGRNLYTIGYRSIYAENNDRKEHDLTLVVELDTNVTKSPEILTKIWKVKELLEWTVPSHSSAKPLVANTK